MKDQRDRGNEYFLPRLDQSSPDLFQDNLGSRHRRGSIWKLVFQISTVIGIIALATLVLEIFNDTMGYAAIEYKQPPATLVAGEIPLDQMTCDQLWPILSANVSSNRLRTIERDTPREGLSQQDCYNLVLYEVAEPTAK